MNVGYLMADKTERFVDRGSESRMANSLATGAPMIIATSANAIVAVMDIQSLAPSL